MRRHITEYEFHAMRAATRGQRHATRDALLLQLLYDHGLRVSEALALRVSNIDFQARTLYIERLKSGRSGRHPLRERASELLTRWRSSGRLVGEDSPLFMSERGRVLTRQQVHYLVRRYGQLARLPIAVFPHMLRHGAGYALADRGVDTRLIQDYLGHRSIQSTVIYTSTNAQRFATIWNAR